MMHVCRGEYFFFRIYLDDERPLGGYALRAPREGLVVLYDLYLFAERVALAPVYRKQLSAAGLRVEQLA